MCALYTHLLRCRRVIPYQRTHINAHLVFFTFAFPSSAALFTINETWKGERRRSIGSKYEIYIHQHVLVVSIPLVCVPRPSSRFAFLVNTYANIAPHTGGSTPSTYKHRTRQKRRKKARHCRDRAPLMKRLNGSLGTSRVKRSHAKRLSLL